MEVSLRFIDSKLEIRENLSRFNQDCTVHRGRTESIARQTQYWIYDGDTAQFAPSKFAAYAGMTFSRYDKALTRNLDGANFDGAAARKRIERTINQQFVADPSLGSLLSRWGEALLGPDLFGSADPEKWKFVKLNES
jgi:hypothetical protein